MSVDARKLLIKEEMLQLKKQIISLRKEWRDGERRNKINF